MASRFIPSIVRATDGQLFGYEALLRSDEASFPGPGAFIEAAERLGRTLELGRSIRGAVARSFFSGGAPSVFVNLLPRDLNDDALYDPAAPLSAEASRVVLEITERESLDGVAGAPDRIASLRRLGYRIAVDDLGSGYAGLNSFALLAPDIAKIDMALVRGVDREPVKRRLITSLTTLCKEMGVLVVAEGIETTAERATLCARLRPASGLPDRQAAAAAIGHTRTTAATLRSNRTPQPAPPLRSHQRAGRYGDGRTLVVAEGIDAKGHRPRRNPDAPACGRSHESRSPSQRCWP